MASVFGHALAASAITCIFPKPIQKTKFYLAAIGVAMFPDADVMMSKFGFEYGHMFGHRGFTHGFVFAIIFAFVITLLFFSSSKTERENRKLIFLLLFCCTLSHGLIDACTTGGKGIAFFAPFTDARYFFPWKVIQVSPMSVAKFFSSWGVEVLKSEAFYIGVPSLIILLGARIKRKAKATT